MIFCNCWYCEGLVPWDERDICPKCGLHKPGGWADFSLDISGCDCAGSNKSRRYISEDGGETWFVKPKKHLGELVLVGEGD